MSAKEITERCQQAISSTPSSGFSNPQLLHGINKIANGIRVPCNAETEANTLRNDFQGEKVHKPNHGIGVPTAELDVKNMTDTKVIEYLEIENNMEPGTITKMTLLRARRRS